MNYASALRQGADSTVTPVPSANVKRPQPQQVKKAPAAPAQKVVEQSVTKPAAPAQKVVGERSAKYEGNLMGAFNQLVSSVPFDKSQSNPQEKVQSKLRPPKAFTIRKFLVALGWPSLLLGLTCHSFDDELKEIRHRFDPRPEKVHFSLVLQIREREKKETEEKSTEKETEKPTVPSFEGTVVKEYKPAEINGPKRKALVKYWQKVVEVAQFKKDIRKVNLGGGLVLTGPAGAPFLDTKDLGSLHLWAGATCNLLRGSRKEQVPYQDGSVSLSRCGSNGNFVIVRLDLKARTSGQLPSQIYKLEDFSMSLRALVKSFLPLVAQFQLISTTESKKVNEGAADDYVERENIIKNILKPASLDTSKSTIKKLIQSGAVVGSQLPQKFANKAAAKKENESEFQTAVTFLTELISQESLDAARRQAIELTERAAKERADYGEQRRAENEEKRKIQREIESKQRDVLHPRDSEGKYIERVLKPKAPEPEKEKALVQKKKAVVGDDGFKTITTEVFDPTDKRKVKEVSKQAGPKGTLTTVVTVFETNGKTTTVAEKQKPKAKKTDPTGQKAKTLLEANPFMAVNQEHLFESASEILVANAKNKAEGIAEKKKEKQTAPQKQNNAAKKNADSKQPAKQPAKQQPTKQPAKEPVKAPVEEVKPKPQPKQTPPQPKKAKQPKQKKALVPQEKPFWQDEKSQPFMVGLGFFVVVLAFGYTLLANGSI